MKKLINKRQSRVISFQSGDDNETLALAMLGLSNRAIKRAVNNRLSDSQISYRLTKAKNVEGNKFGYRVDYRNGTSQAAIQIINDIAGIMREEVRRNITPRIVRPEAEVVKI